MALDCHLSSFSPQNFCCLFFSYFVIKSTETRLVWNCLFRFTGSWNHIFRAQWDHGFFFMTWRKFDTLNKNQQSFFSTSLSSSELEHDSNVESYSTQAYPRMCTTRKYMKVHIFDQSYLHMSTASFLLNNIRQRRFNFWELKLVTKF